MLFLKLTLVPLCIFAISQATKKWGPGIGGFLSGLPVIAGPITIFLAFEYGNEFAITSANSTLLGVIGLGAFCFTYSWCTTQFRWPLSLIISLSVYFTVSILLSRLSIPPSASLLAVAATIILFSRLLPNTKPSDSKLIISKHQTWARIIASAILVLIVTGFAPLLGPGLSGIFAVFPLAASILASFTHIYHSNNDTVLLLRGMLLGSSSLAGFYFCLLSLEFTLGFHYAFGVSLLFAILIQLSVLTVESKRRSKKRLTT